MQEKNEKGRLQDRYGKQAFLLLAALLILGEGLAMYFGWTESFPRIMGALCITGGYYLIRCIRAGAYFRAGESRWATALALAGGAGVAVWRLWESFGEGTASWAAGRSEPKGLGFVCCLWRGESLICGSGKTGIPDGKSDRQLLAKKGSYIKVRQVMGLDNASLLFWVLRKTRKTARVVPAALGGVHE